ncbi:ABC transporter substrate-binding protein [Caldovatus sediminis]|uniref:ABC transporter substrate-binding protein n=1 Tax=Caldovatus sediminis TaxID=2041189 RepID=A0A8J2ZAY2_9PROT|nr:ABC transporter substrate-binding protein [Caldovatus sediminis]GGG29542.1 ABC transporter substrate-binding protein [Caldovatus sediminis]
MGITRRGIALGALAAPALLRGAAAQSAPKVRIWGASATVEAYHGFLFLGIPLGFYREQGVEAEFGTAAGSAATLQLVATNQAQLGYVGMETLILAKSRNPTLPVVAAYLQDRGNIYEVVVPEESPVRSLSDLRGRNIGVANLASGAIPSLRAMLAEAGVDPERGVSLLPVGNGAAAATALRTDRVQALALFRAQHAIIETLGFKLRYFTRDQPSSVLAVNANFLRQNRDAVERTLRGVIAGSVFCQVAPQAAVREHWKMFGRPTGVSEEEALNRAAYVVQRASELWKRWDDPTVKWGEMTQAQWDAMQRFMVEQKLMERPIDSAGLFTTELIEPINRLDVAPIVQRARAAT